MSHHVVIGGGIVGISVALALQKDGHSVTVLDPGAVGEGASWASCGCIAVGEIVPLSQPGLLRRVPGWLMDAEAPLSIRPSSFLPMLPWFLRFAANARPSRMRAIAGDLATLTFRATDDFKAQLSEYDMADVLIERPILKLFDGVRDRDSMAAAFELAREMGCRIDEISGQDAKQIEPEIADDFKFAAVLRDWSYVTDPVALVQRLHTAFVARGGRVMPAAAVCFDRDDARITAVRTDAGEQIAADGVVLAAGTSSKDLAKALGISIHLEGLAGYSTQLKDPGVALKHTVFFPEGGFGMTPYSDALAVAGTVEFARAEAVPNWNRADVLVKRAKRVLPGLRTDQAERRFGRRPFTPDTRPIIGCSQRIGNLTFATGHGQLGLTLAATTGLAIADLVAGRTPQVDLKPFAPDRFA